MLAVIIPAYNRPDCLREALQSVAAQTNKRFFTVVVDDCSTEDIKSVCDEFQKTLHLVYLKTKVNSGPATARQVGIDWAVSNRMESIIFLDSDDLLYPNAVQRLSYELNHTLSDIISSPISGEEKNGCGFIIQVSRAANVWLHGKIFRVSFLIQNHICFEDGLRGNEDVNFLIKCNGLTKKHLFIEEPVYLWRDEKTSITRLPSTAANILRSTDYIFAVIKALQFLQYCGKNLEQYSEYITHIYRYYQYGMYYDTIKPSIDELINWLLSQQPIINAIKDRRFWYQSFKQVTQFGILNKKLFFFEQTFQEWLLNHGLKKEILDEVCGN